jgi:adenosylcobinamide-phosphate synthase
MGLEYQLIIALALDLIIGDPRWFPHPVRAIGRFAMWLELPLRRRITNEIVAGMATASIVVVASALVTGGIVLTGYAIHETVGTLISIVLLYTGIAARDLEAHSTDVRLALDAGNMVEAAQRVGMICGRDTDDLDQPAMVRATVESVAENMVDGVTAPLFFAAIGGPVGIMMYKAVNTLDSTFGYKNEKYIDFGWASARLDDLANFIPARITALVVPVAAFVVGLKPVSAVTVYLRDRNKHPSPNAGQTEAAFAGALGLQLGGLSYYSGRPSHKPTLGDPIVPCTSIRIREANQLMLWTSALVLALFLLVSVVM